MTLPETVAVCSLTIAMVANIVFVSRAWGRLSGIIEHLTKSVDSLSASIHGLDAQSHAHANRITRLETIHEANGHRQHSSNGGGSYTVETPRFGAQG